MARCSPLRLTWPIVAIYFCGCLSVLLASCAKDTRRVRQSTYPPQFRYISDDELSSVMWRLAGSVHQLELQSELEQPDVAELSALLGKIEQQARTLDNRGASSNHPYLQSKLGDFLGIVARAKLDLQRAPPHIATVDEVWRACSGCHASS